MEVRVRGHFLRLVFLFCISFLPVGCGGGGDGLSGGGGGSGGSVASSIGSMNVGDIYIGQFSSPASLDFSGAPGAYELLLHNFSSSGFSDTFTLTSSNFAGKNYGLPDVMEDVFVEAPALTVQDHFDLILREEEEWNANEPGFIGAGTEENAGGVGISLGKGVGGGGGGEVNAVFSEGEQQTFVVLNSITNTSDTVNVQATAKCVNSEVAIFIDNVVLNNGSGDYSENEFAQMCSDFGEGMSVMREKFGNYSDINGDGVVVALITKEINELGGNGGIVTGYFWSEDLKVGGSGNEMEIAILHARDSQGLYGLRVSNRFHKTNFEAGVFYHEVQHIISYHQHVVVAGGSSEYSLHNEGWSHMAEDLTGYNVENYSRYNIYLASPHSYTVRPTGSTGLANRGAIYLLFRYLYEQSGKSTTFLNNVIQTNLTGVANVENAYPATLADFDEWAEFLRNWAVALAYTNRDLTVNPGYKYEDRTTNPVTGNKEGVCMICAANDNRGTILTGPAYNTYGSGGASLSTSSTRFFQFSSTPGVITMDPGGADNPGVTVLRVE